MGKRGKTNGARGGKVYWQSAELNMRWQQFFRNQLLQLALARFRWVNLPKTCDARYLEMQLCFNGMATIASKPDAPGIFFSLKAVPEGVNMYGNPPSWRAQGDNGTDFRVDNSTGVMVYDSLLRTSTAGAFTLLAYDMADIVRTKQVDRMHVKKPIVIIGDQAYRQQMANIYKEIAGNEPAIIATQGLRDIKFETIDAGGEFIGDKLQEDLMATWNMAFTFLGISNLPFKSERQTADEIRDYGEPTELLALNALQCRRKACEEFNDRFGTLVWGKETPKKLQCVWNQDVESDAWNLLHDVGAMLDLDTGKEGR